MRYAILVVACVALLFGMRFTTIAVAQGQPAVQRERWEYATLMSSKSPDGSISTSLNTREGITEGSVRQIADKFGGLNPPNQRSTVTALINVLGDQGWELVSINPGGGTIGPMYVFKRRQS